METCDFLVVGGGVVGLSIARELMRRRPDASVVLLDKEDGPARHSSGRNSGVLHAGFYYTADSLKARFTRAGNLAWTDYCRERGLPLRACGKLVVASCPEDLPVLDELLKRGRANGVPVELVGEKSAREIEPRAKTLGRALFSPSTSVVDPAACMAALAADAASEGVDIRWGAAYVGRKGERVVTPHGEISAGFVVNAAGLYADRVARDFGFSKRYRILPFKGLYLYSDEPEGAFRAHIYPVPDIRNPFLGVHFTVTVDGHVKIGPTAIPALWRENYSGLDGFSASEMAEIALRQAGLFFGAGGAGFDFKRLAWEEIRKNSRRVMTGLAARLADGVDPELYRRWGKPGVRAQLIDIETRKLVMDFLLEGDADSLHVLNAVSPGFTCAFPFAAHVVDRIEASSGRTRA
ncbi:MAG TPA: L-2-hydroxyglutarate oxidase [Elusimicrobia bacterium]|nr:MAG: FAD-dependent oxidoreductase [Elusimicrobia bacterium GWC2_65_9]HAZ07865.1 L-2-hydroxyglutarate oxidase [Elusimicrobiota bacterium]